MCVTSKDEKRIALLRANARTPVSELARNLGQSRTTIQDRLRRLEINGVIAGYSVRLGDDEPSDGISAVVEISVEPHKNRVVVQALMRMAQVETLHTMSGKFDLVSRIRTLTTNHIDNVLDEIGCVEGITRMGLLSSCQQSWIVGKLGVRAVDTRVL